MSNDYFFQITFFSLTTFFKKHFKVRFFKINLTSGSGSE